MGRVTCLNCQMLTGNHAICDECFDIAEQIAQGRRPKQWDRSRNCRECGKFVEKSRRCYTRPVCHGCLPPPPPLKLLTNSAQS